MRGTFFRLATVLTLTGLLGVSPALAEPKPIGGKLLKLKTDKGSAKNLFLFKAVAQPAIAAIPDPTAGTTLLLRWQTATGDGRTDSIGLTDALWTGLGKPAGSKGWKYSDREAAQGGVKILLIKPGGRGGLLKVLAKGSDWSGEPGAAVLSSSLDLYLGDDHYCADWDGQNGDVKKNDPDGYLLVKDFSAPGTCADTICGNARVEGNEECDPGTAAATSTCSSDCTLIQTEPSTLETVQEKIFNPGCISAGCHDNGTSQGQLSLAAGESWGNLVDVASFNPQAVVPVRVDPSQTRDDSYLYRKIAARTVGGTYANPGGSAMPFDAPVGEDCLNALGEWIEAGAPASGNIASADLLLSGDCF